MIRDNQGRTFEKLRISLNEYCNFSCTYCVDPTVDKKQWDKVYPGKLTTPDYIKIVKRLRTVLPLKYIRLTGGEPLIYKDLPALIKGLKEEGIRGISITTNGFLLESQAESLKDAGLDSLNISLDAIDKESFKKISGEDNIEKVLRGIEKSVLIGFPIKINSVLMKGVNDHQVLPLLDFSKNLGITIRYIELMKMGWVSSHFEDYFYGSDEILKDISTVYDIRELKREQSSTANFWELKDGYQFGIIANESRPFCQDCNRLRLDSFGRIFGCLSNPIGFQIQNKINEEISIVNTLQKALAQKQDRKFTGSKLSMLKIGG